MEFKDEVMSNWRPLWKKGKKQVSKARRIPCKAAISEEGQIICV